MHGPHIGLIDISDGAHVYVKKDIFKFKANKVTLMKILDQEVDILELLLLSYENGCSLYVDMQLSGNTKMGQK